jgi:hypothetical protein
MFSTRVTVYDDCLLVGWRKVFWDQVIGIKEYNNPLLGKLSHRFPRAELFLKEGCVVAICRGSAFCNRSSLCGDDGNLAYPAVVQIVRANSSNLNPEFDNWYEWRLLFPILCTVLPALLLAASLELTHTGTIAIAILAGLLGGVHGWVWERKARRKRADKESKQ